MFSLLCHEICNLHSKVSCLEGNSNLIQYLLPDCRDLFNRDDNTMQIEKEITNVFSLSIEGLFHKGHDLGESLGHEDAGFFEQLFFA